ncbi:MAG: hypothetical protein AAFX08_02705 [Pseudomonadota bacterium]
MPAFDYWDIVRFHAQWDAGVLKLADLFAIHGGHWHASGYLLSLPVGRLTNMNHAYEAGINLALVLIGFFGLARIIDRMADRFDASDAAPWAIALAAFFLFSIDQAENFFSGWQIAAFVNLAAAIWCIELLTRGAPNLVTTALAAASAAAAIYGFGGGWALLPIGFGLLFAQGAAFRGGTVGGASLALWCAFSASLLAHFVLAMGAGARAHADSAIMPPRNLSEVAALINYTHQFVTAPITRFSKELAPAAGLLAAGLVVGAGCVARPPRGGLLAAIKRLAPMLALGAYALGSGALAGLGRLDDRGAAQARVFRYITQGNFFWIMAGALAVLAAAKTKGRQRAAFTSAAIAIVAMKAGTIANVLPQTLEDARALRMAARHIALCPDDTYTGSLKPIYAAEWQNVDDEFAFLRSERMSAFRAEARPNGECDAAAGSIGQEKRARTTSR